MDKPFGQDLWRNVQSVRVDRDGTFHAPARITEEDAPVVGTDAVEPGAAQQAAPPERRPGRFTRLLRRRAH